MDRWLVEMVILQALFLSSRRWIRPSGTTENRCAAIWLFACFDGCRAKNRMSVLQNTHLNTADRMVYAEGCE